MSKPTRRKFMADTAAAVVATTALGTTRARAVGANDRVRIGIIGCGNQGDAHVRSLVSIPDAEIVYLCDVDDTRSAEQQAHAGEGQAVNDLRRVLDDNSIDAVTIATPDHWHAPAALLALDAGKHVYVEKPCAHNIREGRELVAAARRHQKVAAHGTQARSSPGFREAIQLLRDGIIGDVLIAKCWNWQRRKNIGHLSPSDPPVGVDYENWVGPAEWMPFQGNRFHYNWHWWHNFGSGGMGNDGAHEIDYALWGLGVEEHPTIATAVGGKYYFDDDQQFPDTMQVTFEWPGSLGQQRMLIFEQRLWSKSYPFNVDSGAEFIGSKGRMFISKRGKLDVRDDRNKKVSLELAHSTKSQVPENQQNWIDCIKSGDLPNADIAIGNRTATVIHLGNIATRVGRTLKFDAHAQRIENDAEATALLGRTYRDGGHWGVPKLT